MKTEARAVRPIEERAAFDEIRYGSVWEDADVLCEALGPSVAGGRILSIASAGDNVLAMLTLDPAEVVAADLSSAQLAALALRMAAFRELDDAQLLPFLGILHDSERLERYRSLRPSLPSFARAFWDARPRVLERGIIHGGKFEAYFRTFRRRVLPLVHSTRTVRDLFLPRDEAARSEFFETRWNTWRWRTLFRLFFGRFVMGRLGRDPEFFAHVEGAVASRIMSRTHRAMIDLPTHTNPYLRFIMEGNYAADALPLYLRPEHRATIRERLDRVRMHHGPIEEVDGPFDGFNLSDIFEYMDPGLHEACYSKLVARSWPGARLVYWNMLVPRMRPDSVAPRVRRLTEFADELHRRERAFFYSALHIDEVSHGR